MKLPPKWPLIWPLIWKKERTAPALLLTTVMFCCVFAGDARLRAQCAPTPGTYTLEVVFPFGSTVQSCPGNTIAIRVRANAVDGGGNPLTMDAFGVNLRINAGGGTILSATELPGTPSAAPAQPGISGLDVGAGLSLPIPGGAPLTGPVDILEFIFQPPVVPAGGPPAIVTVDFSGTVTFTNGFIVSNHIVDTLTTCDADLTSIPSITLVPATMTIQACSGNFIRGDCNNNGKVGGSLGDPVASLKFLFLGTFSPPCINACDFNDDGAVSVQDAVNQFGWMFQSGTGPPPPTPTGAAFPGDCGPDPTAGSLTCQSNICP